MEEIVGAASGSGDLKMMEETTNPGKENPDHDENKQSRTDGVHDSLEVALILGTLDQRCSSADEGGSGGCCDNGVRLATLASGSVVAVSPMNLSTARDSPVMAD